MKSAFDPSLKQKLEKSGLAAVLVVDDPEDAVPLAKALLDGGISIMELTLRTEAGLEALHRISQSVPEMIAGAGTVLTPQQIADVKKAGAAFAVAPGLNPRILAAARESELSFAPGIATPTDIEIAVDLGCDLLKFFPAEPMGGLKYLKSIAAPYAHLNLKYIPLGGINAANMADWLTEKSVAALGGSWIAPREIIQKKDWAAIKANAAEATAIAAKLRS
ncbi:MAG: bifunctional 4-hydroxy-2-oxoglutarate aldolase/2-dehydro-3-deoxy-phosphogluconate aldolase [Chthoniobacterales bacterium]